MNSAPTPTPPAVRNVRRRGPATWLLDLLSSVWFGVAVASVLFVFCSIGSAMPVVRQLPALEMTEFEWFHWWPFNVLVILFCTSLILVTVRRIPLRVVNLGVWTIHSGLIVLVIGSYYYFGTKVEGDAPVFRRQVVVEVPGAKEPASVVALPGNRLRVPTAEGLWEFQVQSTNSAWPILSEGHEGETAYSVNVSVQPPSGQPFVRQLLAGYPQFNEDVIPGQGRAVKVTGERLVNADLGMALEYEPQEWFHIKDTWALYVRRVGDEDWSERPIRGMPRYHDRVTSREQVVSDPRFPLPVRPIDVPVPPPAEGDALGDARVHVTGYLRYARMTTQWTEGGPRLNPVLKLSLLANQGQPQSYELLAFDRDRRTSSDGLVQFVWLDDASQVASLPSSGRPTLSVRVPQSEVSFEVVLDGTTVAGDNGPFTPIEGTEFEYRVRAVQDNLVLPDQNRTISVAIVEIKTPESTFRRWVSDVPAFTRDIHGESTDPHDLQVKTFDERIVMTYQPGTAPVVVAGHPGGLHLLFHHRDGETLSRPVSVGEPVEIIPGVHARADALWVHAVAERKPFIVPPPARERDAGETFSMIRLEVSTGSGVTSQWIPFHAYALPGPQYAYAGRFAFQPAEIQLPGGRRAEVVFSRQRQKLPNPVALDHFELDTHVGGYTGQSLTIRNYVSELRFLEDGGWTEPHRIAVNGPTENGGFWYFQSTWDRPPNESSTAGMNYTGLGVGNRNGVWIQLFGCCLMVAGMIYAFYVKPVLKRRRAERARARTGTRSAASVGAAQGFASPAEVPAVSR